MALLDDLKTRFERDVKGATWIENVHLADGSDPGTVEVRLFTNTNQYLLTFSSQEGELRVDCQMQARKARAGLPSPRLRRLLPGRTHRFNEKTWRQILAAIVGMELVRVHRRERAESSGEMTSEPFASSEA